MYRLKKGVFALLGAAILAAPAAVAGGKNAKKPASRQDYKIYVDKEGVMLRSDNKEEAAYYGTNYTLPFAYSYRALGYLGKDRREAIDHDVYQIARLGLNAFRLHLWDAELADSLGNLVESDHLDLLDYMIARLEERGIDILLTTQTNFGNGYPEKNIDTGAFTYDFDKCDIHDNPKAQKIQQNYLTQLAKHVNPYTGRSYAADRGIIAMEINNEPCHSGTKEEVTRYIDLMASTLRKAGFDKPILYNVTHNPAVTSAYYDAKIDGTTYQWYPTGLVAGHQRKGNFLPMIDTYNIPWKESMPNYDKLARTVYEFDPADVLYAHLYPAVVRTMRKEGFQWLTQLAYDPTDIAQYNTEYPTHYLNLLYTPSKAVSMMVAANAMGDVPRGADYGSYPANTRFGNTYIDYEKDLSVFSTPGKYIHSNTAEESLSSEKAATVTQIAGVGNSPFADYSGNGAYFIDRIPSTDLWRLEVYPDATIISDPFGSTSLNDSKILLSSREERMKIKIPALAGGFTITQIVADPNGAGSLATQTSDEGNVSVVPGVFIIAPKGTTIPDASSLAGMKVAGNIGVTEYGGYRQSRTPIALLQPEKVGSAVDVAMIPEEWSFALEDVSLGWDSPNVYKLTTRPTNDGRLVVRRYIADKLEKLPLRFSSLRGKFRSEAHEEKATPLPEGTRIGLVLDNGVTYAAPIELNADGTFAIPFDSLVKAESNVVPAPYPVMMLREFGPDANAAEKIPADAKIEFIEIVIPQKSNTPQLHLIEQIWVE